MNGVRIDESFRDLLKICNLHTVYAVQISQAKFWNNSFYWFLDGSIIKELSGASRFSAIAVHNWRAATMSLIKFTLSRAIRNGWDGRNRGSFRLKNEPEANEHPSQDKMRCICCYNVISPSVWCMRNREKGGGGYKRSAVWESNYGVANGTTSIDNELPADEMIGAC